MLYTGTSPRSTYTYELQFSSYTTYDNSLLGYHYVHTMLSLKNASEAKRCNSNDTVFKGVSKLINPSNG